MQRRAGGPGLAGLLHGRAAGGAYRWMHGEGDLGDLCVESGSTGHGGTEHSGTGVVCGRTHVWTLRHVASGMVSAGICSVSRYEFPAARQHMMSAG